MNNDELRTNIKGVVVDAGHGGDDPGAINGNIKEKDFNLKAATYMAKRLNELGIPAVLTRDQDETLTRNERLDNALKAFGKDDNVILISNHINAGGGEGAEVVYALRNNDELAKSILDNIGEEGQLKRTYYQRRLPEDPSKDYYYIMRLTEPLQSLLVEYGFIDNQKDLTKLENNLLDYVEGAVKAIALYANVPYISPSQATTNTYTVQKGDTLYSIANKLQTTVTAIKDANNLTNNILQPNQVLIIPVSTPKPLGDTLIYIVQQGDTLSSIAQKYNTTIDAIINLNQLSSQDLQFNQQLLIPNIKETTTDTYYTVQSGDSLYSIASKYGLTVDKLKDLNNLMSNTIMIGQKLLVQDITAPSAQYIVQKGDSLYSIAKQYNVSIDALKKSNNLSSNLLTIGQILLIPNTTNYIKYYVQSGDSLYRLANKYNITVDDIIKANNLTNNLLQVGQLLIIPQK